MKKLLFLLAFTFIGQQAFSQMYMVVITDIDNTHPLYQNTTSAGGLMTVIDPSGSATYTYLTYTDASYDPSNLILVNQKLNSIISLGYKLVAINPSSNMNPSNQPYLWDQIFFLAIP